jgi:putative ABC transport system substrate-binding protein
VSQTNNVPAGLAAAESTFEAANGTADKGTTEKGTTHMDRRTMIGATLGLAALTLPKKAMAAPVRKIGFLTQQPIGTLDLSINELNAGLVELGYAPGKDIVLIARYGNFDARRFPALTAELLAEKVELIIGQGSAAVYLNETPPPVPVVFIYSGDPIVAGFAESLARPKPNITGVTFMSAENMGKRIELLAEIVPGLSNFALIANPEHFGHHLEQGHAESAAARLNARVQAYATSNLIQLDSALSNMSTSKPQGIVVHSDIFALNYRSKISEFGLSHRIPVIGGWEIFARNGFLLTYGPNRSDSFRRLSAYVDRLLKGKRPNELPIEQPTKFELTVNLKTARAIGVTIPPSILFRAGEVIE